MQSAFQLVIQMVASSERIVNIVHEFAVSTLRYIAYPAARTVREFISTASAVHAISCFSSGLQVSTVEAW
jgi:hypothetical protein